MGAFIYDNFELVKLVQLESILQDYYNNIVVHNLCSLRLVNRRRRGLYKRCAVVDNGMVITVFYFWNFEEEWMAVLYRPTGVDLAVFSLPRSVSVLAYLCTRIGPW